MKLCWPLVILGLLLFPSLIQAASETIYLDNYYYAHANKPGKYVLSDKYNHTLLYGDYNENDGDILQIGFRNWHGMAGANKLIVTLPNGTELDVSDGTLSLALGDLKSKYVKITMIKTDYVESFVELSSVNVYDRSNGGVTLTYIFVGKAPSSYGDLGTGSPTPTATPKPTATPTPNPTPTPSPTPQVGNLLAYRQGDQILWTSEPSNTDYIDVYKNGIKVATIPKGTKKYDFPNPEDIDGNYELRAVSTQGNVIAKTVLIINVDNTGSPQPTTNPNPTDPGGGTEQPCSAGCQNIIDQLECPQWDEYMGKWADMIQSVIPPPPDWDMVADKIGAATINHLSNYLGEVPAPPTREEIKSETQADLPGLDTSVETNDIIPEVPDDYNSGKIIFDLNKDAPTIDVKDESQPFIISDPLTNVPHDDPGVMVFPNDERNSTGGFKQPDKVDTGEPEPTPGKIIFELPRETPPVPKATPGVPPIPNNGSGDPPIPGATQGEGANPGTIDSIIPMPKGGSKFN